MEEKDKGSTDAAAPALVVEVRIHLDKPINVGPVPYEHLDLREPTAGELSKMSKISNEIDALCKLVQLVAAVPEKVVEQLPQRKLQECNDFFASFSPAKKE